MKLFQAVIKVSENTYVWRNYLVFSDSKKSFDYLKTEVAEKGGELVYLFECGNDILCKFDEELK